MLLYMFLLVVNAWSIPAAPLFTTNNKCLASSKLIVTNECDNLNLSMSIKVPTEENTKVIRCSLLNETFNNLCNARNESFLQSLLTSHNFEDDVQAEEACPRISSYLNKTGLYQYFNNLDTCKKICVDFGGKFYNICKYIAEFSYLIVHPLDNLPSDAPAQIPESVLSSVQNNTSNLETPSKLMEHKGQETISAVPALAVVEAANELPNKEKITPIPQATSNDTKPAVEAKITSTTAEQLPTNVKTGTENQAAPVVDSTVDGAAPHASQEVYKKPIQVDVEAVSTTTIVQAISSTTLKTEDKTTPTVVDPEKQNNKLFEDNLEDSNAENDLDNLEYPEQEKQQEEKLESNLKPIKTKESMFPYANDTAVNEDDSYFFFYFMVVCVAFVLGYVGYHNKQKILAIVLEGRKGRRSQRRRPNSANYHKLDCNLEEAVTSTCSNKSTTNVIY